MTSRLLICLLGVPFLLAFQNSGKSTDAEQFRTPVPSTVQKDSTSKSKKTTVKEVKANKTKIHHIKKVDSTPPKTIN